MSTFNKDNLRLVSQGIVGGRIWHYTDTGAIGDVSEAAGYFTNAYELGMRAGDFVYVRATDGGNTNTMRGIAMSVVQDTGATQGTAGLSAIIGDTS